MNVPFNVRFPVTTASSLLLPSAKLSADPFSAVKFPLVVKVPIPLPGEATLPEIALYSFHDNQGVAKFAATEFSQADGTLVVAPDPEFAYSHSEKRTAALFISWSDEDFLDEKDKDPEDRK